MNVCVYTCKIYEIVKMDKTLDKTCKSSPEFCDSSFTLGDEHQT